ncbi:hypothetical protein ACFYV5_17375 [Streptomyces sp. NPDC003035]|uniref:hypothetical protein n=1 Tax=Streptomyces sp. NPDC003035 TaxID=3364676 RepID=UPI0036C16E39
MDRERGGSRRGRVVDWFDTNSDLPHLFAWISELVHVHGYAPEDLVVIARAELDRRETAAFTAGWAEAVSEELPRIRREYERRVADAYAQGQRDARGVRRPQRRAGEGEDGARVIPLPFARLLEPPAVVIEAEERLRREREQFDERGRPREPEQTTEPEPEPEPGPGPGPDPAPEPGRDVQLEHATAGRDDDDPPRPRAEEPEAEAVRAPEPEPDVLFTAQELRARRATRSVRKVVRGKGGRPVVPPLGQVPGQGGSAADRRTSEPGAPETRGPRGRRLSERARALEEELVDRAQEPPPEPAP